MGLFVPQRANLTEPDIPPDKFRILYADPPWAYQDAREGMGGAVGHYPVMDIRAICDLQVSGQPVREIVADDAVLFLWVTSPILMECEPVFDAWGFTYKASFVWDKAVGFYGHYNNVRHEFLLLGTRGSCTPETTTLVDSIVAIKKERRHSAKPSAFRGLIDQLYPRGQRLELFSRERVAGWKTWGDDPGGANAI